MCSVAEAPWEALRWHQSHAAVVGKLCTPAVFVALLPCLWQSCHVCGTPMLLWLSTQHGSHHI